MSVVKLLPGYDWKTRPWIWSESYIADFNSKLARNLENARWEDDESIFDLLSISGQVSIANLMLFALSFVARLDSTIAEFESYRFKEGFHTFSTWSFFEFGRAHLRGDGFPDDIISDLAAAICTLGFMPKLIADDYLLEMEQSIVFQNRETEN